MLISTQKEFLPALNYFNYFTEIEETFIRRRGRHLFLSPIDWALMEKWKEQGIPLRIILRGINNVFDSVEKNPTRARSIKSLTYCRDEVESLFNDWRGSQVGKSTDLSEDSSNQGSSDPPPSSAAAVIEAHIARLSGELKTLARETTGGITVAINSVLEEIERCGDLRELTTEAIEQKLDGWEKAIDTSLLKFSDPSILAEFRKEIENDLANHRSAMEEGVYQTTFDL
ncbi:MAG: hypothetical protein KDB79_04035, partial [Acidobacteria bacterium]|nr:hypothetical protein [Acidobacteriota bacterium]